MAVQDIYRTNDGKAFFTFRFEKVGSIYEIDIVSMPDYRSRAADAHSTHRLPSIRGGYRICLADESQSNSLEKARKWAEAWAERTWKYIENGIPF